MAFPQCGSSSTALELIGTLRNAGFCGERKSGEPVATPLEQKKKNGPHMTPKGAFQGQCYSLSTNIEQTASYQARQGLPN